MFNSMFDELNKVKHFKEITDFKSFIRWNTLNKERKRFKSLQVKLNYFDINFIYRDSTFFVLMSKSLRDWKCLIECTSLCHPWTTVTKKTPMLMNSCVLWQLVKRTFTLANSMCTTLVTLQKKHIYIRFEYTFLFGLL